MNRRIAGAAIWIAASACAAAASRTAPSAAPAPPTRGPVTFSPGTAHYRSASYVHVEQRVGDQTQQSDEARVYYLTASLVRQAEHLRATLTVDSVSRYQAGGPSAPGAQQIRGVAFAGELGPDGEIRELAGGDSAVRSLAEMREELSHLYPRIPPGGVAAGTRWTDTTETTSKTGGLPLAVVAISQHEAGAATDSGTEGGLALRTSTTYTYSGQGSQGGQVYSVTGDGRRHTVELLGPGGRFLGMISADTSTFAVSMPALDVSIPGRQTRADTLSLLP